MTATKKPTGMKALRSELLDDVVSNVSALLLDYGIESDVAEQVAVASADFLAEHWGGQQITFPKEFHFKLAQRDLLIYDQFSKGHSYVELSRTWNMGVRGIRKVISRVQKRVIAEKQPDLFADF